VRWQPGDQMLVEMVDFGMPFMRLPVTVVWDRPDELALWFAEGTTYWHRVQRDGSAMPRVLSPAEFARLDTRFVSTTVPGRTALAVLRPGRAHAIQLHWDMPGWRFQQWYVNLQTPFERTTRGIRSTDQFLDIVVNPDQTWRWKDYGELDEAVRVDRLTTVEAAAIRSEGERVAGEIERGHSPFVRAYTQWRPDSVWRVPPFHTDRER
jgi:hypothetical protein